ncbi:MAG: hypothetical protein Q8R36_03040 [bacterium]|nr:hypothetical protein [bacterium]
MILIDMKRDIHTMSERNKLIAIEAGDGSGKTVQTELLVKALREHGVVTRFDFPRYETFTGKFIRECLIGVHGDFLHLPPHFAALPYMIDRVNAREELYMALSRGRVVCNRYVPSNIAHQSAKVSFADQGAVIAFIEKMEYETLLMPRPDIVIYLYVPVRIAATLIRGDGGVRDQHEQDLAYQERVGTVYRLLSEERKDWVIIECMKDEKLMSPEEIHKKVMEAVLPIL